MVVAASAWQSVQALLAAPAFFFHAVSPSSTQKVAGLAVSSSCMARVSRPMSSYPERRGSGEAGCAQACDEASTSHAAIPGRRTQVTVMVALLDTANPLSPIQL